MSLFIICLYIVLSMFIFIILYNKNKKTKFTKFIKPKNLYNNIENIVPSIDIKIVDIAPNVDIKIGDIVPSVDIKTGDIVSSVNIKIGNIVPIVDDDNIFADINDNYILPTVHENFITPEEANYIIMKSENNFNESIIVSGLNLNIRKSMTAWIPKHDSVVKNIILRVCEMANVPFENAEYLQVVKYNENGYYNPHYDTVTNTSASSNDFLDQGGHRVITMLIYLNDNFTEGATKFVTLDKIIKPPKYGGILFYTFDKEIKKCHPKSLHAGLPIKTGTKYIANVWIREKKYQL